MLNFAVGPVMIDPEILNIGSNQIPYFRTDHFSNIMLENEALMKKIINATYSDRVIFLTGSGTAAMEAAVINTFTKKDKLLIVNGGTFGARFKKICDIYGIKSQEIYLKFGEQLQEEHFKPFEDKGFTGLLINIHETSSGILYNIELVKEFCKRNSLFLVVDAISSFLADPYDIQGINVTILSSQKALALPPGMSFLVVDEIAQERILNNHVHSLYFDLKEYLLDGKRGQTPFTPAVSLLLQLRKRLENIDQLGVDNIINKVADIANDFRTRISGLPLEIAIPTHVLSNALTPLKPLGKMEAIEIFNFLKDNYNIFVCPNGGSLSKTIFRVGHIGALSKTDNDILLRALFSMEERGLL